MISGFYEEIRIGLNLFVVRTTGRTVVMEIRTLLARRSMPVSAEQAAQLGNALQLAARTADASRSD